MRSIVPEQITFHGSDKQWARYSLPLFVVILSSGLLKLRHLGHPSLHSPDECCHALVAKNLLKHPLKPTLIDTPYLPTFAFDWGANHVWLHKPILGLWQIAGSYWLFGVNTWALRFPSVILSTLAVLGGIASFSLFVSGISIMNICLVSVGEKTREIGLRKSVGAKGRYIFWQFLTESVCLCLCGGILGIGFGYLTAHGMALLAVKIVPVISKWPVVLSMLWILISVFFSLVIGVSFGLYPAMRAARLSPIDALRTDR